MGALEMSDNIPENAKALPNHPASDPFSVLKDRLARGELSIEEYEKTRQVLGGADKAAPSQGTVAEEALKTRLKGIDRWLESAGRSYDGLIAVGAGLVGAYLLWKHRPVTGLADGVSRVAIDPDLVVLKDEAFYIGIVVVAGVFLYGLKKFLAPKQ
jgi:hypothetical protein